jgi:phosphoglycolate phosphatase-like HAD superfamily hydrolase
MSIAIFDIDGVVADVRHRLHHLRGGYHSWDSFFDEADLDPLLQEGADLVRAAADRFEIVWLTGRPEWLRDVTEAWMLEHNLPCDELYMRPYRDYRPAARYKLAALRRLQPRGIELFVDDDPEVIAVARAAGVAAVLAEWVPREDVLDEAQERLGRT